MTRIRIIPALLGAAVLAACSKDGVQIITAPTAGAFIKFYNFGVNAPSVNFFANDTKLTAISSTSCTPPTVPPNPLCAIDGDRVDDRHRVRRRGERRVVLVGRAWRSTRSADKIAAATDNGLSVAKLSSTLANAKHYSLYTSGFYDATAKTMDAFVVEDVFSRADRLQQVVGSPRQRELELEPDDALREEHRRRGIRC